MPDNDSTTLPAESDSQRIGHLGVKAVHVHSPDSWRIVDLSGDDEVGYDLHVQLVSGGRYRNLFHIQVKASIQNCLNTTGEFYSVPLAVKTLNYYRRQETPLMLVFVDFTESQSPKDCKVVYKWIHDEIRDRFGTDFFADDPPEKTITFRVFSNFELNSGLDIAEYLQSVAERQLSLDGIYKAVEDIEGSTQKATASIERIGANLKRAGLLYLETISGATEKPWPEAMSGSLLDKFRRCEIALDAGQISEAEELLKQIAASELDEFPMAEYEFLRGRHATARGDRRDAIECFGNAYRLMPEHGRYVSAYFEARFIDIFNPDDADAVHTLLAELPNIDSDYVAAVRARMLGAVGQFSEADEILARIDPQKAIVERVLSPYMERDWQRAIDTANKYLNLCSRLGAKATIQAIKCRCLFYQIIDAAGVDVLPPSGMPGLDFSRVHDLWGELQTAMEFLRSIGWPRNAQFIFDIVAIVSIMTGRSKDVLPDMLEFVQEHRDIPEVLDAVLRVAVHAKDARVVTGLAREISNDPNGVHDAILVLYEAKERAAVAEIANQLLSVGNPDHEYHSDCLLLGALCATAVLNTDVRDSCLARLDANAEWKDRLAVFNFIDSARKSIAEQERALEDFRRAYESMPSSKVIQDQLITALPTSEMHLIIDLKDRITSRRQLFPREVEHVVQACLEGGNEKVARSILDQARRQFSESEILFGLEPLVLEAEGRSAEALSCVEELIASNRAILGSRTSYINIALRCGLHDKAVEQLEHLLSQSVIREQRFDCLRNLFALETGRKASSNRLIEIASRIGQLADQETESEEAAFLASCVILAMGHGIKLPEALDAEFLKRADSFFERFPDSSYISRLSVSDSDSPQAFLERIKQTAGFTKEREQSLIRIQNQLSRGQIAAPFCWRPRNMLPAVGSVAHLWELAKQSGRSGVALHLTFAGSKETYKAKDLRGFKGVPLIDLTSLLILAELDLFELLFRIFDRIAITKRTILHVQQGPAGFDMSTPTLLKVRDMIHSNFSRILQPGEMVQMDRTGGLDEIKELVNSGKYSQYSDDACCRVYVQGDAAVDEAATTIDVLATGELLGWCDSRESAARIAHLIRWNFGGVPLYLPHFLSTIPEDIGECSVISDVIQTLAASQDFMAFCNGAWSFDKPYSTTVDHIAAILASIINDSPHASEIVLAGILSSWLDKVQFRPKPEFSKIEHLAAAVRVAAIRLRDDAGSSHKLWSVYGKAVERAHGPAMDEEKDAQSRRLLGRMVADLRGQSDSAAEKCFLILESGLTKGTADCDAFVDAYTKQSAAIEARRGESAQSL